jgi:hypothetical protein
MRLFCPSLKEMKALILQFQLSAAEIGLSREFFKRDGACA